MSEPQGPDVETKSVADISVDRDNLYREEVITDLKAATLRRLVPIQPDGTPDASRPQLFLAETQLLTQGGLLPVQARLEGESLDDAIAKFPEAINEAVERMVEEAREAQRREASRIVVPSADVGPPGGKIQLR